LVIKKSLDIIKNIKCFEEKENIRFTFNWIDGFSEIYVFKSEDDYKMENGYLCTAHEYKKRGGLVLPKTYGRFFYSFYPYRREDGEDVIFDSEDSLNKITHTCKINISYSIKEKTGRYKNYEVSFSSDNNVTSGVLKYSKGNFIYDFNFCLKKGQEAIRIIRTNIDEEIKIYISEEKSFLYNLKG